MENKKNIYFYSEFALYTVPEDKEEALQYLRSWKKFLLIRLSNECYVIKSVNEQFTHKEAFLFGPLFQPALVGIKLAVEIEPFAVNNQSIDEEHENKLQ